jgi:hypothetical protein
VTASKQGLSSNCRCRSGLSLCNACLLLTPVVASCRRGLSRLQHRPILHIKKALMKNHLISVCKVCMYSIWSVNPSRAHLSLGVADRPSPPTTTSGLYYLDRYDCISSLKSSRPARTVFRAKWTSNERTILPNAEDGYLYGRKVACLSILRVGCIFHSFRPSATQAHIARHSARR